MYQPGPEPSLRPRGAGLVRRPVEFTLDWLEHYLCQVAARFPLGPIEDWSPGRSMAILRHDVDLDLEPALELARWAQQRGWRGTYFVLTTSDGYNPFSRTGRRFIQAIRETGSRIGLHLDSTLYSSDELEQAVKEEASRLSWLVGEPVRSVSLHGPNRLSHYPLFQGFLNAYDPLIFGPGRYLSDSSRHFRSDPYDFLAQASETIQLLFHPLHFASESRGYPEIFRLQVHRMLERVDEEHRQYSPIYREVMPTHLRLLL